MTFPLPALSNLLNAVGEALKPEVTAVIDLKVREDLKGPGELVISKGSAGTPLALNARPGQIWATTSAWFSAPIVKFNDLWLF